MFNLVSLLVAAALVSLQCGFEANAQLDNPKMDLDNNLQINVVHTPKRRLRRYVHISLPPPETARLEAGQRLELECQANGAPSPSISWLKNGDLLTDYEEEANEIFSAHPSSFARLTSKLILTAPSDGDVYTCVATSGLKQESASTTVFVEGSTDILTLEKMLRPTPPTITTFYNEIFQELGTNLVLPCRVHSYGKAQVFWLDSNKNLVYGDNRLRILPSGDLLIKGLIWPDMGEFTCTAKNMYGKDSATTFLYTLKP